MENNAITARLFVDPGSTSAGWALYYGNTFVSSGTVAAKGRNQFARLAKIAAGFSAAFTALQIDEIHIETLNYQTHYACIWSVGVIGALFAAKGSDVHQDVFITAWQNHANWKHEKGDWAAHGCKSEDEFAAKCMGRWWLAKSEGTISK